MQLLDPLATITVWDFFGEEINENEKLLLEIWAKTPELGTTHGTWPSTDWEVQAVETLGAEEDWPWWLNFSDLSLK